MTERPPEFMSAQNKQQGECWERCEVANSKQRFAQNLIRDSEGNVSGRKRDMLR